MRHIMYCYLSGYATVCFYIVRVSNHGIADTQLIVEYLVAYMQPLLLRNYNAELFHLAPQRRFVHP